MMREQDLQGLRLGAYVRISSDLQDGKSQNQRADIERFLAKHRLEVVDWYPDDEGRNPRGRINPEFRRMMKEAQQGRINGVLVAYAQRLGFIGPPIVSELLEQIKTLDIPCWDILERRDLRECYTDADLWRTVVDGTVRSAKGLQEMGYRQLDRRLRLGPEGRSAGGPPPYGMDACYYSPDGTFLYRIVYRGGYGDKRKRIKIMGDGLSRTEYNGRNNSPPKDRYAECYWEPTTENTGQLDILRLMFNWCDKEGLSAHRDSGSAQHLGYKTASEHEWEYKLVERCLEDTAYIVRPHQCRHTQAKYVTLDPDGEIAFVNNQRPQRKLSNIEPLMPVEPICNAIIWNRISFGRVQERLAKKKERRVYADRTADAWGKGLIWCAGCGRPMTYNRNDRGYHTWRCSTYNRQGAVNGTGCGAGISDKTLRDVVDKFDHTRHLLEGGEADKEHEEHLGELLARFEAMEFGDPDPAELARLDTEMEKHRADRERMAERALTLPELKDTEAFLSGDEREETGH